MGKPCSECGNDLACYAGCDGNHPLAFRPATEATLPVPLLVLLAIVFGFGAARVMAFFLEKKQKKKTDGLKLS
jgi:hypothetical protein